MCRQLGRPENLEVQGPEVVDYAFRQRQLGTDYGQVYLILFDEIGNFFEVQEVDFFTLGDAADSCVAGYSKNFFHVFRLA